MLNEKSIWSIVKKLVYAASVYIIWQERNRRLFQNCSRTWEETCTVIENNVKFKLCGLKVIKTDQVQEAFDVWEVKLG